MLSVGSFEYSQSDLIGHGAFALVFRGRAKKVWSACVSVCASKVSPCCAEWGASGNQADIAQVSSRQAV